MARITYEQLRGTFQAVLEKRGMAPGAAGECAALFAEATRDGVATHGANRFPVFVAQIEAGDVAVDAVPVLVSAMGAFERWDGQRGPGNRNAARCMDRAIQLARAGGMGCVALRNTNHWMRGGAYGLRAAASNCLAICWSNAVAAMPAWGGQDSRLGTNPLVLAAPGDPPVLADVSMSQFSYGRLQEYRLAGRALPVPGGYGPSGLPTDDPAAIEATRRVLPIGLWKGSALATVLDLMAAVLSDGHATVDITTRFPRETGLSQVFLAFSMERLGPDGAWTGTVERLRAFIHASVPAEPGAAPRLPGERAGAVRATGDREGIPVDDGIWAQILAL